jgi:WD40 repeat protein
MDAFEAALQGVDKIEKKKPGKLALAMKKHAGPIRVLGAFKSMAAMVDTSVGGRNGCYDAHKPFMFALFDGQKVVGLDLEMRSKTASYGGKESGITSVVLHAGIIIAANKDGKVCAHCRDSMRLLWMRMHEGPITALQIHHGLVVTASQDTTVSCWRLEDGKAMWTAVGHVTAVACVHVCGGFVLCGAMDGNVRAYDLHEGHLWFACNFPKNHMISSRQRISKFDPLGISITCLHSSGGLGFVGCKNGRIYSFAIPSCFAHDMRAPPIVWVCTGYTTPVTCMTSDRNLVYTGSGCGDVSAWELQYGQRKWNGSAHQGPVQGLALGPNRQLVSGGSDGKVHCWSVVKGDHKWEGGVVKNLVRGTQTTQDGAGHRGRVTGVAVVAKLGVVVSVSEKDGSARAWNLATGEHSWTYLWYF